MLGLVGGFLTPMLVGDPNAGAVRLLVYLALLDVALFLHRLAPRLDLARRGRGGAELRVERLSCCRGRAEDAIAAGVFIILLALAASLVRPGEGTGAGLIQPLAIGIVQLAGAGGARRSRPRRPGACSGRSPPPA